MAGMPRVNELIDGIKEVARSPEKDLRGAIEKRVERTLADLPMNEKLSLL